MNIAMRMQSWAPAAHAALRVMTGLLFMEHGTGKMLGFPLLQLGNMPHGMLIFTGLMELVGGLLITIGFLTRPTAFILSGFMAAAYFIAHAPQGFFPALNFGEPAILYCFVFLFLSFAGPGAFAVDKE